ncbi:MAG: winged helix-turn-helix domain-containing protein [Gammaproteobacteria bacterium]
MGGRQRNYASGQALWIGDWRVDPSLDLLQRGDETVKLEPRKMRLLIELAQRPGELVLADELIDNVWKDVVVTPNSLYQSIAQLRRLLGDDADQPRYIVTVPRKGYRLIAPVRPDAPAPAMPEATGATEVPPAPAAAPSADLPAPRPRGRDAPARRRVVLAGGTAALAALGATLLLGRRRAPTGAEPLRLAVVAFRDESPQLDGTALADALSEEVIRQLSADARLRVVARDSSHTFRAGALDPAEVARQLGVVLVLEGAVRRSDDEVRLTLSLHDAPAGRVRWSDRLVRPVARLPQLPRLVAEHTLAALALSSLPPPTRPDPPLAAFEAYVQGTHALRRRTPEALHAARGQFERAIALMPGYAEAHAALAWAWLAETDYGVAVDHDTALARAREALERATAQAPNAAEVLAIQGLLYIKRRELANAREPLRRAIALRPSHAAAHFWLGVSYAFDGRPREAMPHYAVAAELNPLDFQIHARLGTETMHAGLAEQALRHFDRARELAPHHPNPLWGHALVGYARGRLDDAVRGYRAALALEPRRADLWLEYGWVALDLGLPALAARALAAYRTHGGPASDWGAVALRDAVAALSSADAGARDGRAVSLGEQLGVALSAMRRGDADAARAALDAVARRWPQQHLGAQGPYALFLDRMPALDVAAVATWLHDRDADAWLALARTEIERCASNGCAWHSLAHQRARLLALGGQPQAAIEALRRAVDAGWRRAWGIALDPALAVVAPRPEVGALLGALRLEIARQRARVEREGS